MFRACDTIGLFVYGVENVLNPTGLSRKQKAES